MLNVPMAFVLAYLNTMEIPTILDVDRNVFKIMIVPSTKLVPITNALNPVAEFVVVMRNVMSSTTSHYAFVLQIMKAILIIFVNQFNVSIENIFDITVDLNFYLPFFYLTIIC